MRAICNTSPLLLLAKIGRLDLLAQLYTDIIIPAAVLAEIEVRPGPEARAIRTRVEKEVYRVYQAKSENLAFLPERLGAGEREVIAVAIETRADLVILDDREARRVAHEQDIPLTGTIGVLIEARTRDMISSVRDELDGLILAGMWINPAFYQKILQELDE